MERYNVKKEWNKYIKECLNRGYTLEQVKDELISHSYKKKIIKKVIDEYEKDSLKRKLITKGIFVFSVLVLIIAGLFLIKPTITGLTTITKEVGYNESLYLVFNESSEYKWLLENVGELKSLRLSGSLSRDAVAEVYIENNNVTYLIFDSNEVIEDSLGSVTGLVVLNEMNELLENQTIINRTESIINETLENQTTINESIINETLINETESIINETLENISTTKNIVINLKYKENSSYDTDNDGIETLIGVVDFSVDALFNWNVSYDQLCTRWEVYNQEESTIVCYGNEDCCSLLELVPERTSWNETFYLNYGKYGAGYNNKVTAQVIYANYSLVVPYSDIAYSDYESLTAKFLPTGVEFNDICIDTCLLIGFNSSSYKLIINVSNGSLSLREISYSVLEEVVNKAPYLVKNISTVNINKNENITVDLSEYFIDPDNDELSYSYYDVENITVLIEDYIAIIVPDKGFSGRRYSYFTANDSSLIAVSDVFAVDVVEESKVRTVTNRTRVVIGKPVKWVKKIVLENLTFNLTVSLPKEAYNLSVNKIVDGVKEEIKEDKIKVKEDGEIKPLKQKITGAVIAVLDIKEVNETFENSTEIIIEEAIEEVEIEYETPGPEAAEEVVNNYNKKITISSDMHYTDVLAYTSLPIEANRAAVKLYWLVNDSKQEVEFDAYDNNDNGLIDYIEWIVSSLSSQTFEVEITILNIQSYPTIGGNWTVRFNTSGVGNLTISAVNGTTYSEMYDDDSSSINDLTLLELKCGNEILFNKYDLINKENVYLLLENNSLIKINQSLNKKYKISSLKIINYNCSSIGEHTVKVLTAGVHTQEFEFGDKKAYAYNQVILSECTNISAGGVYKLDTPISDHTTTCFTINVSNVELDCQNNLVDGLTLNTGIHLDGRANAELVNITIRNCRVNNFSDGIYFDYVNDSYIYDSVVSHAVDDGFYVYYSNKNYFSNITVENCSGDGIYVYYSDYNVFANLTLKGQTASGLNFVGTDYSNFTQGNIINNTIGISSTYGTNNRITHFNITENNDYGIYVSTANVDNNYIYDNYFNNTVNLEIDEDSDNYWNITKTSGKNIIGGDFIAGNFWAGFTAPDWDDDGIGEAGNDLGGGEIDYMPLVYSNQNLTSCALLYKSGSFYLESSISDFGRTCIWITGNNIEFNGLGNQIDGLTSVYGIYIQGSSSYDLTNITLRNCNVNDFSIGIYVYYVNSSFIYDSSAASANTAGIKLTSSDYNTLENITLTSNTAYGIQLSVANYNVLRNVTASGHTGSSDCGINIAGGYNNITGGYINNNYYGIYVKGATNNRISLFNITNNSQNGFYIGDNDDDDNHIFNNYFNNSNDVYITSGAVNFWNTSYSSGKNIIGGDYMGGNYWTGYTAPDNDGDGIADVGKIISGTEVDYHPLIRADDIGNLTTCSVLNNPGVFYLESAISNYAQTCFTIISSDVELNCQNYEVDGGTSLTGIYSDGGAGSVLTNITIRNCPVNNFASGIELEYTNYSFIYNSQANNAATYGFYLSYSDYNTLNNITATGQSGSNDAGVLISSSSYNNLTTGVLGGNYYGIYFMGAGVVNMFTGLNINASIYRGIGFSANTQDNNLFYDNFFNNSNNVAAYSGADNSWNTSKTAGTNIIGGSWIAGNFWVTPTGTGFSQTCSDNDMDGICDSSYTVGTNNVDFLPLNLNDKPNDPSPNLVSVDGINSTITDLNCSSVITDPDNNTMNVSAQWFKNDISNLSIDYNNSYANGTEFYAILGSGNTTLNDNWTCSLRLFDGLEYSAWVNSSKLTIIDKIPPVINLNLANDTWQQEGNVTFDYKATDTSGIDTCILYGNFNGSWEANKTDASVSSGVADKFNLNLTNGSYIWNVWCNDSLGNGGFNGTNFTVYVDTILPNIELKGPVDNYNTSSSSIEFNWTAEDNLDKGLKCNLTINGTINQSLIESANGSNTNITVTGFNEGTYYWNVTCWDNASNINISETRTFARDGTDPVINLNLANDTWQQEGNVTFDYKATDSSGIDACILYGNFNGSWEANKTDSSVSSGVANEFNLNLTNGTYLWNVLCNDSVGNSAFNGTNFTVYVDTILPNIELKGPIDNYNTSSSSIEFNWTATDNLDESLTCNLTINNLVNESLIESANGSNTNLTVIGFNDGTYYWNVTCIDNASNINISITRTFTRDVTGPIINLNLANDTFQQEGNVTFDYNATDSSGIDSCILYGNFNGSWEANKTDSSVSSGVADKFNLNLTNGTYLWNVLCNDSVGNSAFNATNFTVTVDTILPTVALISPANYTWSGSGYTFTATYKPYDSNLDSCTLYHDYGTTWKANQTDTPTNNAENTFNIDVNESVDGEFLWNIWCNDSAGNSDFNATNFTVRIDTDVPTEFDLAEPVNNTISANLTPLLNWTETVEGNFKNYTVEVDDNVSFSSINYSYATTNITNTSYQANISTNKTWYWRVIAYDLAGNNRTTYYYVYTTDTYAPLVSYTTGTENNNTYFNRNWIYINVTASDQNEANTTFMLVNTTDVVNETTLGVGNRSINFTNLKSNEQYWYNVTVSDKASNKNTTETRTITLDSMYPTLSYNSGTENNNTYFNRNWIYVNVTANDTNEANLTFMLTNTTAVVNETTLTIGNRSINFTNLNSNEEYYYNVTISDKVLNKNTTETRTITLDSTNPDVALISPANYTWSGSGYTFTATYKPYDSNLDSCTLYHDYGTTWKANQTGTPTNNAENTFNIDVNESVDDEFLWNIWCNDSAGNSDFNATNFTVRVDTDIPTEFDLAEPVNNTISANLTPLLNWTETVEGNFKNYTVEVDDNVSFSSINYSYATTNITNTSYQANISTNKTWYWRVIAYDLAGNNRTTYYYVYTTDTKKPTFIINITPNPAEFFYENVSVNWTVDDIHLDTTSSNLTYPNGTLLGNFTTNYTLTKDNLTVLGNYTVTFWANDSAGNSNSTSKTLIIQDTTAPTEFDLTSPVDGTKSYDLTPLLNWSATTEVLFKNYTIEVSESSNFVYINFTYSVNNSVTNTSYQVETDWPGSINLTWRIKAYDTSGNSRDSTSAFRYETAENTPPTAVNLTLPLNATKQIYNSINFDWTASTDANNDGITYELMIANDTAFTKIDANITSITTAYYETEGTGNDLTEGRKYWKVRAYDATDYSAYSNYNYFDSIYAIINITAPENNSIVYPGNVTEITVKEVGGGDWINNLTLTIMGVNYTATNNPNWAYNYTIPNVAPRKFNITAIGFNLTDNLTITDYITLRLSKENPSLPIIDYVCSNETYRLNNTRTKLIIKATLDTLINYTNLTITTPSKINETLTADSGSESNLVYYYYHSYFINETGNYTLQASVTDIENQTTKLNYTFYSVTGTKNVTLNSNNVTTINIKDVCSGDVIASGTEITKTIPINAFYDVEVTTEKPTITFFNSNLTGTFNILNYTELSIVAAPSNKRRVLEFEVETGFTQYDKVQINYNYSAAGGSISDETNLVMYRCSSVDSCTWSLLSTDLDTDTNVIYTNQTTLSVFLVAEPLQTTTETVTTTTTTTVSGGGGGTVKRLVAMELIAPSPLSIYAEDSVTTPIFLRNKGEVKLNKIYLSAEKDSPDLSLELSETYFEELGINEKEKTDLTIISHSTPGRYEIKITANVTEPEFSDSVNLYVDLLEREGENKSNILTRVVFSKDLFKENPECLEMYELIQQAETALENKEYENARILTEAAINGCKDLITSAGKELVMPSPKPIIKFDLRLVSILIAVLVGIIILVSALKRIHKKKGKVKKPEGFTSKKKPKIEFLKKIKKRKKAKKVISKEEKIKRLWK